MQFIWPMKIKNLIAKRYLQTTVKTEEKLIQNIKQKHYRIIKLLSNYQFL